MALIWADSFDHYGTGSTGLDTMIRGAWASIQGLTELSSTEARTGNLSLKISQSVGSRSFARRVFNGPARNTIGLALGVFLPNLPGNDSNQLNNPHGVFFRSASGVALSFVWRSDGSIEIFRGPPGISGVSLGSTDAGVLIAAAFVHLEIAAYLNTVTGWIEIRRDGVTVFRLEEVDTGSVLITNMELGASSTANFSFTAYYDDLIAWDGVDGAITDFVGPARVLTMLLPGDGTLQEWSKNGAATGHECVEDIPPDDDTTYIQGEEVGDRIEFTMPELPPEVVALAGVFFPTFARIEDAGVGRIELSLVDTEGEPEVGAEIALTPVYAYQGTAFQTNPTTGLPWTPEEFEAATLRVRKSM